MIGFSRSRERLLLMGVGSILLVLAAIEIFEIYRIRTHIAPSHLLFELMELAFLTACTVGVALMLARPRNRERDWPVRIDRPGFRADAVSLDAVETGPRSCLTDGHMELLQRLHHYGAGEFGHRIHERWLRSRCSEGLARRFPQVLAELRRRNLVTASNGWLALTPAGCREVDQVLFVSTLTDLMER